MNYSFPYYGMMPMSGISTIPVRGASGGIFRRLLGGFNVSSLLSNTQKTLNLVNQTIPIVKQINPLIKNAKTMFRVMNEFKKVDDTSSNSTTSTNTKNSKIVEKEEVSNSVNQNSNVSDGPVFFIN